MSTRPEKIITGGIVERAEIETALKNYQGLFHKVLHVSRVYPFSPDYEDYFQQLQLAFFQRCLTQEEVNLPEMFRYLCWQVRDHQRKNLRQQKIKERSYDRYQEPINNPEAESQLKLFLTINWPKLSRGEQIFLKERWLAGRSIQEIADQYQVSRSTIFYWRKQLAKRLGSYFYED